MENITNNNKQNEKHLHYPAPSLPLFEQTTQGLDLSMFALDLSRKNNITQSEISRERINLNTSLSQTLPECTNKRYQEINLPDTAIAGSSTMLSPYSESNSPKRMKLESADHYENSSQLKHNAINMYDITPNMIMVTPQQPVLNIPGTSQPFIIHDEAERKISLAVPTECSTSTDARTVKKVVRPFKAYPKDILPMVPSFDDDSNERFRQFRETWFENKKNGNTSNPKMRRVSKSAQECPGLPTSTVQTVIEKNQEYWERRKKNNEAAKRSREARRAKEDALAVRAAFLERENAQLRSDLEKMCFIYNRLYSIYYQSSQMSPISS